MVLQVEGWCGANDPTPQKTTVTKSSWMKPTMTSQQDNGHMSGVTTEDEVDRTEYNGE